MQRRSVLSRTIIDADGRVVEEGEIWLIERFLETIQTVTPITQWGIWDARIVLDIYDWAGNYGPMPRGEHDNELEFSGISELISFMEKTADAPLQVAAEFEADRRSKERIGLVAR